ncbi:branched-chain amino acid ABC transporter permease [Castellaniella sp.]|uniref:branched-chain amino acid ABC transporter permease n=1 Tax=Castellaniella sp. TaxID=1955812 RepID=UPI003A8F3AEA
MVRIISLIGLIVLTALGIYIPWTTTPIIIGLSYAIAASGVSVLMRAGQVSFGHAMFACFSAYTVAYLARAFPGMDALALILAGTLVSTIMGMIIGLFVVRYRGIFFGMLNLALSMVLFAILGKLYHLTGGTDGLSFERPSLLGITLDRKGFEIGLMLVAIVCSGAAAWYLQRFTRSGSGQTLAAIKTNETRLEYLGFSAYRILWSGYVLSALVVGVAGSLLALIQGLVTPETGFWLKSAEYVFIAILGGTSHVIGAFLGALVFELARLAAAPYFAGLWQFILGLTLVITIFLFPTGIVGQLAKRRKTPEGQT